MVLVHIQKDPESHIFVFSWFYASLNRNNNTKRRRDESCIRQPDRKTSRKEGHCRYLALTNDLIYDRFIKHQNYVNKPLKTINCCKNCASTWPLTQWQPSILAKCNAQHRSSLSVFRTPENISRHRKGNNTTLNMYHGWIDVKWNFESSQQSREICINDINYTIFARNEIFTLNRYCYELCRV